METWEFDIIEIRNPWHFLARRVFVGCQPNAFTDMMAGMTEHLDSMTELGQPVFKPSIGEICAAQKRDGSWHRVCVEGIDKTDYGRKLKCYLIDQGAHQSINANRLHKIPSRFQTFPAQVYKCRLWGIEPLMLAFDETDTGLSVQHLPSNKWDVASVKFMNRTVEESCGCRGDTIKRVEDNSLLVRLFLNIDSNWLCLNDELVKSKFASHSVRDDHPSLEQHCSFDSEHTTPHTSKDDYNDMPSLSLCSDSDSEMNVKKRQFIQANLKRSLLLSPSKDSKSECVNGEILKSQKRCVDFSDKPRELSSLNRDAVGVCNESLQNNIPSKLKGVKNGKPTPGFAGGRASLNQVLATLRPGGLSTLTTSQESTNTASDLMMKSALFNLGHSSTRKSTSNAIRSSVSSVKATAPLPLPPQSSSTPLSSSLSTQESDSGVIHTSSQNEISPVSCLFNGSDSSAITPQSPQSYVGTGARPKVSKVRFLSPPSGIGRGAVSASMSQDGNEESLVLTQPRHRKNLTRELEVRAGDDSSADKESLMGKIEGERLLQRLRQKSGLSLVDTESALPKTTRPDKPQVFPNLGTCVFGRGIPLGMYNVMDYPFVSGVKKVLFNKFEKEMAHGIEAYTWPAILAGRNVVGVSQARVECEMAYIPPLLSLIADRKEYASLPQKMGPLVLVIVPSWKRARAVYNLVGKFTGDTVYENRLTRTIALYAGGTEECVKTEVALIRGCEILVTTPGSLLRSVTGGVVSLKRVCHLVFDNADILSSRFQDEISGIMQMYSLIVKERQGISVPHQVLIFSRKWSAGLDDMRLRYTKHPILSFSSRLEASVYGEVKQMVVMCRSQLRLSRLSDLIDSLANSGQRVIAWTSEIEEAKELAKTINSRGVYCMLTHHGIESDSHIEEIRQRWLHSANSNNGLVVLVATDPCYQDLAITDATAVIHYDMPQSKTRFGNRLACMYQHFSDRLSEFKSDIEPVSHVILTETCCAEYAQSFMDVLKRCKSDSPNLALEKFIHGYVTGLQTNEGQEFCPSIKSFGFCLNQERCENRHVLVPERDLRTGETTEDTLPVNGEIKLKVVCVASANRFYCHLLEHRSPDNTRISLREDFQSLMMEMALFYSKESNHVPYLPPHNLNYLGNTTVSIKKDEAGLCGFKTDDGVQRAKVVGLKEGTRADPMKKCRVWLVDAGHYDSGTIDQLVKLPQRLAEIPYQAVEVFVCRIKPIDKEAEWTDRADIFVNDMVQDKILIGRIVFRLGISMWLDPLVHQVMLKRVGLANDLVIRQEILANNYASPNPEHIQLLCDLCRGKVDIPENAIQRYLDYCLEMELTQESLPADEKLHDVNIAAVISPDLFYIQRWENIEQMEKLETRMCEEMDRRVGQDQERGSNADLGIGSVGVAKSYDGMWYRVKIISKSSDDHWEVFSLDYGDRQEVRQDCTRPLPRDFAKLPCQAIECEMANLAPAGSEWSPECVDILCDLSYYVDREKKKLSVKVYSGVDQSFSLTQRLVVDVYGCQQRVWFAEELVWRHVATWTGGEENAIQPILDKPALKNQLFFNSWDKLPYLCANIYWAEKPAEARVLAKELNDLLSQRPDRWDSVLMERQLLPPLVQIIGYVSDPTSHEIVLDSLVNCCLDSQKLCEVAINENLSLSLSLCLEQVGRREIQSQAFQAVRKLMTRSSFMRVSTEMESIIVDMIKWHNQEPLDPVLLDCCCGILCMFMQGGNHGLFLSYEDALFSQITGILNDEGTRDDVKKPWLQLLSAMAATNHPSVNQKVMKESTIRMLKRLLQTLQSSVCLSYIVLTLQSLVDSNRKFKIILLESGLRPLINQICQRMDSSAEKALCKNLLSTLTLQFPAHEGLAGRRIEDSPQGQGISLPPVAWTETCFKIQLKVKVKNASVDDFGISSNNLQCCALSEGTMFHLDWDLYANIIPSKSRVEPHSSHTIISLRKEIEGKWGRLLKQKIKPPNLSPDFDHLWDSEEEEEDNDENSTRLAKKRKGIFENLQKMNMVKLYSSEEEVDDMAVFSHSEDDDPKIDTDLVHSSYLGPFKASHT